MFDFIEPVGLLFIVLLALLLLVSVIDCLQTRVIAANPARWRERNPLLRALIEQGWYDSTEAAQQNVVAYFIGSIALGAVLIWMVYALLSPGWAFILTGFMTLVETGVVIHNASNGIDAFPDREDATSYGGST